MQTQTVEPRHPVTQKRRNLWDIAAEFEALDNLVSEGGELTDELEKLFAELDTDLEGKVDGYASWVTMLLARSEARKQEAKRMTELARIDEAAAERCKARLFDFFKARGIQRMDTRRHRISVAGNGGLVPLSIDETKLPTHLVRIIREPDKTAIHDQLKHGPIPGVEVLPRGEHLRIK